MTTILEIPTVRRLESHPVVLRQQEQLQRLQTLLAAAEAHEAELVALRQQHLRQQHDAAVNRLITGASAAPAQDTAVAAIDAKLTSAREEVAVIREAIGRHQVIADGVRAQVADELKQEAAAAALALVREMGPRVEELLAMTSRLAVLSQQCDGAVPPPLVLVVGLQQFAQLAARS